MTRLYAQPCDMWGSGFCFDNMQEYQTKAATSLNRYGEPVEEYNIHLINAEPIDIELADAVGLNQCNIKQFFDAVNDWSDETKTKYIIANNECGYRLPFDEGMTDCIKFDIYHVNTLTELAEQFVDDGLFGEVPETFFNYIDFDAIARDLAVDYSVTEIAGQCLAYRCG